MYRKHSVFAFLILLLISILFGCSRKAATKNAPVSYSSDTEKRTEPERENKAENEKEALSWNDTHIFLNEEYEFCTVAGAYIYGYKQAVGENCERIVGESAGQSGMQRNRWIWSSRKQVKSSIWTIRQRFQENSHILPGGRKAFCIAGRTACTSLHMTNRRQMSFVEIISRDEQDGSVIYTLLKEGKSDKLTLTLGSFMLQEELAGIISRYNREQSEIRIEPLIYVEEADYYFAGPKSMEEVAEIVQNRVSLYLAE